MSVFDPRPVHLRFVVDRVTLGQIVFEYFGFTHSVSSYQCVVFIRLTFAVDGVVK